MPLLLTHAMLLFSAIAWFLTGAATPSAGPADIRLIPQIGHSQSLRAAAFSPDGRFIITGSDDKTAKLWDPATGVEVRTFAGHTLAVRTARLWDAGTGAEIRTFSGHSSEVRATAWQRDRGSIFCRTTWATRAQRTRRTSLGSI